MGVLTDFVVVPRDAAEAVGQSHCPYEEFDGIDAKGMDTVKLAILDAVLTDAAFDPRFMSADACLYGVGQTGGPWVFEVPAALVSRLAALEGATLTRAGEAWAASEEFSPEFEDWPTEAVHQKLEQLVALAQRAIAQKKSLLMWMSL